MLIYLIAFHIEVKQIIVKALIHYLSNFNYFEQIGYELILMRV